MTDQPTFKKCYVCCQRVPAHIAVTAAGQDMCPQHLTCNRCNVMLEFDVWKIGTSIFCQQCYETLCQAITCGSCKGVIERVALHELGSFWHKTCFVCQICRKPFVNNRYCVVNKKPYCRKHAEELVRKAAASSSTSDQPDTLPT